MGLKKTARTRLGLVLWEPGGSRFVGRKAKGSSPGLGVGEGKSALAASFPGGGQKMNRGEPLAKAKGSVHCWGN